MAADPETGITILHPNRLTVDHHGQVWITTKQLGVFPCYYDSDVGDIIAVRSKVGSDDNPLYFELAAKCLDRFWLLPIDPTQADVPFALEPDALAS